MAHHSATLFAPWQIAISVLPSSSTIHIYFLLRELLPSCVGAICCFLLLRFAFIHFQSSSNAAIVEFCQKTGTWMENKKGVFLTEKKSHKPAFTALIDTCKEEI